MSNQLGIVPTNQSSTLASTNQSVPEFVPSEPTVIVVALTITLMVISGIFRKHQHLKGPHMMHQVGTFGPTTLSS